jgi:hypothetical protein
VKRSVLGLAVLASAAMCPVAATAASTHLPQATRMRAYDARLFRASEARRIAVSVLAHGSAAGRVIAVDGTALTIQTPGETGEGVVNRLIAAANRITRDDYPYVWGGGHAQAGVASTGSSGGPGYNGHTRGFDCSGSVAAVLAGADLWAPGSGVPSDAGVIAELRGQGLIAAGAGTGANEVTLYDDPGVHIFLSINGWFFGTSDGFGGNTSEKHGGAGWLYDGAPDASSSAFRRYHFVPSALARGAGASRTLTVQLGAISGPITQFLAGDTVKVSYEELGSGSMMALGVALQGLKTATATVTSISGKRNSLVIHTTAGRSLSLVTAAGTTVAATVATGDTVSVGYTNTLGHVTLRTIVVEAVPTPPTGTGTTGATGPVAPVPADPAGARRSPDAPRT